ncbi:MAG: putative membrane-anchored protein [Oleispira sp.]|jgi:uncharacterized membrane-anchored protein
MHHILSFTLMLLLSSVSFSAVETADSALSEQEQYNQWATQFLNSIQPQSGSITIEEAGATLNIPENFYFLNAEDAERVLVEAWGNPPGQNALGMLFPAGVSPLDSEAWAVTIAYEEEGYVSDENAEDIDYDELLEQMQEDTRASSIERDKMGYGTVSLVGWASAPYYDASSNKLHWAKEIRFDGTEENTLNYNVRVLGRKGVLVLDFIAGMNQLPLIKQNLGAVLDIAEFDQGASYADFNPDLDKVAAYGIGALVAGKVIAKTGFLVVALLFLKKFGIFILLGLGALYKMVFKRKEA